MTTFVCIAASLSQPQLHAASTWSCPTAGAFPGPSEHHRHLSFASHSSDFSTLSKLSNVAIVPDICDLPLSLRFIDCPFGVRLPACLQEVSTSKPYV